MGERVWGNKYRHTVVCIDAYDNCIPVGRISNPYLSEPQPFYGVVQFFKQMEKMLNDMRLPQSFTEMRSFSSSTSAEEQTAPSLGANSQTGALATFSVNVIFRQNASWQGIVTWMEAKQEESFRSAMELISLMDSALNS